MCEHEHILSYVRVSFPTNLIAAQEDQTKLRRKLEKHKKTAGLYTADEVLMEEIKEYKVSLPLVLGSEKNVWRLTSFKSKKVRVKVVRFCS